METRDEERYYALMREVGGEANVHLDASRFIIVYTVIKQNIGTVKKISVT